MNDDKCEAEIWAKRKKEEMSVTEFADKCAECGANIGRRLKQMREEVKIHCIAFSGEDGDITADKVTAIIDKYIGPYASKEEKCEKQEN